MIYAGCRCCCQWCVVAMQGGLRPRRKRGRIAIVIVFVVVVVVVMRPSVYCVASSFCFLQSKTHRDKELSKLPACVLHHCYRYMYVCMPSTYHVDWFCLHVSPLPISRALVPRLFSCAAAKEVLLPLSFQFGCLRSFHEQLRHGRDRQRYKANGHRVCIRE